MTTSQSGKKEGNRLPVLARPDGKSRLFQISMKTYCLLADIRQYQQISKKWSETSRNAKIYEIIYPHLNIKGGGRGNQMHFSRNSICCSPFFLEAFISNTVLLETSSHLFSSAKQKKHFILV